MAERQQALAEHLLKDPAVASISSFIGVDGTNTTLNTGRIQIDLKPHAQRDRLPVVLNRLAEDSRAVPGIRLYAQPVQDLTIEDRQARTQYQLLLSSPDMNQLTASTRMLVERLQQLPQLLDVSSDLQNQGRQAYVQIDRAQASRLGVTVSSVDSALYNAFGQRLISTIFTQSNQYRVVLEVAPQFKIGPEALQNIYAASSNGAPVPLSSIATVSERPMALAVNHVGQLPAATISFNTASGVSLGHAVEAAQTIIAQLRDEGQIPLSVDTQFQGAALAFQASLSNTLLLVLAAIITMYIVLGVLYESTIHPITILSTLPSAGVGRCWRCWCRGWIWTSSPSSASSC
jgi:multidrug efflux pump